MFRLDLRSIALFRIGLGLILIFLAAEKFFDLNTFYGNASLWPLTATQVYWPHSALWPWIHAWSDSAPFLLFLFGLELAGSIAFTLGWKTRWVAGLLYYLNLSFWFRYAPFASGISNYVIWILLWFVFIDSGAFFSIRTAPEEAGQPTHENSIATCSYVLFIIFIYSASGFLKTAPHWHSGEMLSHIFRWPVFARASVTQFFVNSPSLLRGMGLSAVWLERLGPLLLLIPRPSWIRLIIVGVFILFQMACATTLHLGWFGFFAIAVWIPLLPFKFLPIQVGQKIIVTKQSWRSAALGLLVTLSLVLFVHSFKRGLNYARFAQPPNHLGWTRFQKIDSKGHATQLALPDHSLVAPSEKMPTDFFNEDCGRVRWQTFYLIVATRPWDWEILSPFFGEYLCREYMAPGEKASFRGLKLFKSYDDADSKPAESREFFSYNCHTK